MNKFIKISFKRQNQNKKRPCFKNETVFLKVNLNTQVVRRCSFGFFTEKRICLGD